MLSSFSTAPAAGNGERNLRQALVSKRIPLRREIALRFPHLPEVVSGVCWNISMTGMFIRSRDLAIPGATVSFELPPGARQPIRGQAEVTWVRQKDDGPERPRGFGLRFLRLNPGSPQRIRRAVEKRVLDGGTLSDLDEMMSVSEDSVHRALAGQLGPPPQPAAGIAPAAVAPAAAVDPRRLHPYAGAAAARSEPAWRRYRGAALAAVLFAALVAAALIVLL